MTLERSERRLPPTQNQRDALYKLLSQGSASAVDISRVIEYKDEPEIIDLGNGQKIDVTLVNAVESVIAESFQQSLIEPTGAYAGLGNTRWKLTPRGRKTALRDLDE